MWGTVAKVNPSQGAYVGGGVLRWLALCVVVASSSGCATVWAFLEVTDASWSNSGFDTVKPLGDEERRVVVSGRYAPPAPPEPQPVVEAPPMPPPQPEPGVVVVQPAPQPMPAPQTGRPFPQGTLELACVEQSRFTREEVVRTNYRYDTGWKLLTAFSFVAEAALSTFLIWAAVNDPQKIEGAPLGIGIGLGLDAIGTAILFWHPPETQVKSSERDGVWKTQRSACPPGLAVSVQTGDFAVQPEGDVPGLGEWMLQHVVDTPETALMLKHRATVVPWQPSLLEKCEWSNLAQSPAPYCRWNTGIRTEAIVPLLRD